MLLSLLDRRRDLYNPSMQALHELLLLCFQKDVDRRITADKLLKHPWISAAQQHNTDLTDVRSAPSHPGEA